MCLFLLILIYTLCPTDTRMKNVYNVITLAYNSVAQHPTQKDVYCVW